MDGYIVSERVKEIFEKHNLPSHAFYPAKIHSGDLSKDYYWFHFFNNDFWNWVDREKSKLYLWSIFPGCTTTRPFVRYYVRRCFGGPCGFCVVLVRRVD